MTASARISEDCMHILIQNPTLKENEMYSKEQIMIKLNISESTFRRLRKNLVIFLEERKPERFSIPCLFEEPIVKPIFDQNRYQSCEEAIETLNFGRTKVQKAVKYIKKLKKYDVGHFLDICFKRKPEELRSHYREYIESKLANRQKWYETAQLVEHLKCSKKMIRRLVDHGIFLQGNNGRLKYNEPEGEQEEEEDFSQLHMVAREIKKGDDPNVKIIWEGNKCYAE